VSAPRSTVGAMKPDELFLHADAALRDVIDRIDPADFAAPVPQEWSQIESPTLRGILGSHAYDEAWIPDVIAGRAAADGDPFAGTDLLGDDPIAAYDALNDAAGAAVRTGDFAETFRFTYGDYPASEGFAHMATLRHPAPPFPRGNRRAERARRARHGWMAAVGRVSFGDRATGGGR
jgi:hypothetical protein